MARRRLMWAVLSLLVFSVLFWVSSVIISDKKESITRHRSILDHLGQAASRNYIASQLWTKGEGTDPIRKPDCTPETNVVFIKTHKTASSTTSGIFDHYAYRNNLTVAVPPDGAPFMDRKLLFQRDMVADTKDSGIGWKREDGFNMLTAHARYNRPEMDAVVHNAKFVTILRDPRAQFVSSFVFFNFVDRFKRIFESRGEKYSTVIEGFIKNPMENYQLMSHRVYSQVLWNQQMFDLGLDTAYFSNPEIIEETLSRLDSELDLVMITEYYDESLLVLKDILCWEMDDILYTQRLVRNSSSEVFLDSVTKDAISEWNAADTRMYDYFNKTLWRRIASYGPNFQDDLKIFRQRLAQTTPRKTGKHSRDTKKIIKRMKDRGILVR
ncbi:galactosylceramide sulfotransferase isoform X1 [Strongylocentrotus purpuratus]|uniref:Galactosylceramide sulfotransferase-like n=1 Tax=Strongylocentrotus purpuratus TaxID=7668 RepID=A0A7M7REN8_STRPU|nr:galactosylceramide sulfotransferase isoform X1 [Strongylocentrotus purpuratus]